VQARVVSDVTLDVPGLLTPATGHIVSIGYGNTRVALQYLQFAALIAAAGAAIGARAEPR
jgi:hypothetical protein